MREQDTLTVIIYISSYIDIKLAELKLTVIKCCLLKVQQKHLELGPKIWVCWVTVNLHSLGAWNKDFLSCTWSDRNTGHNRNTCKGIPTLSVLIHLFVTMVLGCLYVIGGKDNKQTLSSVEKLDCQTNTWSYVKPLPKALSSNTRLSVLT